VPNLGGHLSRHFIGLLKIREIIKMEILIKFFWLLRFSFERSGSCWILSFFLLPDQFIKDFINHFFYKVMEGIQLQYFISNLSYNKLQSYFLRVTLFEHLRDGNRSS